MYLVGRCENDLGQRFVNSLGPWCLQVKNILAIKLLVPNDFIHIYVLTARKSFEKIININGRKYVFISLLNTHNYSLMRCVPRQAPQCFSNLGTPAGIAAPSSCSMLRFALTPSTFLKTQLCKQYSVVARDVVQSDIKQ